MNFDTLQQKKIRGRHDTAKTPTELYDIVQRLGFIDVCVDINDHALLNDWPSKAYCNPPFSLKTPFVKKAIAEHKKGKKVLLYLPLDPTVSWFRLLYENNVVVLILMKRWRNRWPTALYYLTNSDRSYAVFIDDLSGLETLLKDE